MARLGEDSLQVESAINILKNFGFSDLKYLHQDKTSDTLKAWFCDEKSLNIIIWY